MKELFLSIKHLEKCISIVCAYLHNQTMILLAGSEVYTMIFIHPRMRPVVHILNAWIPYLNQLRTSLIQRGLA